MVTDVILHKKHSFERKRIASWRAWQATVRTVQSRYRPI